MIDVNSMNQAFLAANPDIRKRLQKEYDKSHPKVIVMSLKPKYAKAIYEGRKNWEFRKTPPPLFKEIYIYESAPVSEITGTLIFTNEIRGLPLSVYDIVKTNKCFTRNLPGITALELEEYAGRLNLVSALRVHRAERLEHPITFSAKPPQNWGTFRGHLKHGGAA
jgi:predicted transcriptional regulator